MIPLKLIKDTVTQVAEAITAVLGIETEIVDDTLLIIGGTGRYKDKVGEYEEDGDLNGQLAYARILRTGKDYVCIDPDQDPYYDPIEKEFAEISCAIIMEDNTVVGLIGLVAFDEEQKQKLIAQRENLLTFLKKMANLIASKLAMTKASGELEAILESMSEGLIATDINHKIVSCNKMGENLLGVSRDKLAGKALKKVFPTEDVDYVLRTGQALTDREYAYKDKIFLSSINPIKGQDSVAGCMILFQDLFDARKRMLFMTTMETETSFENIVGSNKMIMDIKKRAFHVATSDSTILITGESGTGKGVFARAIHSASQRRENPFISINCGAIPDMLLESELFGYEKGAFTGAGAVGKPGKFEMANKGTIFLDEIGDLPIHLQVKLLHVLQNKMIERVGGTKSILIDVRIIAATNKNLEEMIVKREFREDLYFRLNVIPLYIPPLRERKDDLEEILHVSLHKFNAMMNKEIQGFTEEAMGILLEHKWPGNVREVENVVEYAVNMETEFEIKTCNLPEKLQQRKDNRHFEGFDLKTRMDEYQREMIEDCLAQTGHSLIGKQKAAKLLGISESTLYRRVRELGIREQ